MLWDRELSPFRKSLNALPQNRGLLFVACCIDRAAWRFQTDHPTGHDALRVVLPNAMAFLWSRELPLKPESSEHQVGLQLIEKLQPIIDGYEKREIDNHVLYLSYGCQYALYRATAITRGVPSPFEIANYAYQYTWYRHHFFPAIRLFSGLGGALATDLDPLELECEQCIADLRYQVSVATRILSGEDLNRSNLVHQ